MHQCYLYLYVVVNIWTVNEVEKKMRYPCIDLRLL